MTQEDKQLLLQDLCARLPYGVIVRHADCLVDSDGNDTGNFWYKRGYLYNICRTDNMTTTIIESEGSDEEGYEHICDLERTLPYLRPMSSMTEKEKVQLSQYACIGEDLNGEFIDEVQRKDCAAYIDWLNKHHFDYRGLIERGLAIEAPEGMYNLKIR